MVGRLAAAHPRPRQPRPAVVSAAGCSHAQVQHPTHIQDMHLAGNYFQRCTSNLRAGHPLQPPFEGQPQLWQSAAAAAFEQHPGGPMGSCPAHPPGWAEGDGSQRDGRQRAVDQAHRDLGVPGRGCPVHVLHFMAQLQRLEVVGGCSSPLHHRGRQLKREAFALNRATINRQAALSFQGQGTKKESRKKRVALSETDKVWMLLSDLSLLAAANDLVARGRALRVEDVLPILSIRDKVVPRWLGYAFAFNYAPATVAVTPLYLLYHLLVVPILHMAALLLFAISEKNPYKRTDVKITYIILCLTAALDVLQVFVRQLLSRLMSMTTVPALCQTVASYNLIDTALWEANNGWIFKFASRMRSCFCRPQHYGYVGALVISDLVDARERDLASYRVFDAATDTNTTTSIEGVNEDGTHGRPIEPLSSNWTLSKELQEHCGVQVRNSLCNVAFDRSVLLWHIATDLCRRCSIGNADFVDDGGEQGALADEGVRLRRECAVAISDYMAHLLHVSPEMLMTGSRHYLISEAVEEVKYFFFKKKKKKNTLSQQDIEHFLAMEHKPVVNEEDDDNRVFHTEEASKLAKELMAMPDGTRWRLMFRVWLGMLCYSASMCRGNLHAKSLAEGGEFLTLVWLILGIKGAKCLTDKLQMPP
ncbi:hypothetical protein QYE76_009170 [Lolium multiflorum]|uniref:DUF4220 domain-containing protein n=1 Tax=Lolium multiflorum TaxID=4521 RepID=A0AAD8TUR4_LOLMU|nr:hypothetical protein QYE76_009170 [Lolium multiflorum]